MSWGDSLTQTPYLKRLGELLGGRTVNNGAVGGQTSTQIAARQGGVVTQVTLEGNRLPPSGPALVIQRSVSPLTDQDASPITGSITGIHGTLRRDPSDRYTFTRDAAGSAVDVPPQSAFLVDTFGRDSLINVFWMGRNNAGDPEKVKQDIAAAIAFMKSTPRKFVVLSILNGSYEPKGTANYALLRKLNEDLRILYPSNFVDVRTYLINRYDASNALDVADFRNDVVPTSMRGDELHINEKGSRLVAEAVASFIGNKGW